ncbi:MAG: hypothetical protein IKO43_05155, partial [Kiritimatiellae bacterium]|nr:hypothetical protein [Kiritimatiellia bacterium]
MRRASTYITLSSSENQGGDLQIFLPFPLQFRHADGPDNAVKQARRYYGILYGVMNLLAEQLNETLGEARGFLSPR